MNEIEKFNDYSSNLISPIIAERAHLWALYGQIEVVIDNNGECNIRRSLPDKVKIIDDKYKDLLQYLFERTFKNKGENIWHVRQEPIAE
ncbi:MAG: hypothetical protein WC119_02805 [Synergistaceae bacterium]